MFDEYTMGKWFEKRNPGEYELKQTLRLNNYHVEDVSGNPRYWDKDIDLLVTNPATNNTVSIEVKWDRLFHETGNMFIETYNPRSKNSQGWFNFCEADYLAYGDAIDKKFYMYKMSDLREYIENNKDTIEERRSWDGSRGYLLNEAAIAALFYIAIDEDLI